jgi:hypothetical protein
VAASRANKVLSEDGLPIGVVNDDQLDHRGVFRLAEGPAFEGSRSL